MAARNNPGILRVELKCSLTCWSLKKNDFGEQHDILVHGSEIRGAPAGMVNMAHYLQRFICQRWLAGVMNHQQYSSHPKTLCMVDIRLMEEILQHWIW